MVTSPLGASRSASRSRLHPGAGLGHVHGPVGEDPPRPGEPHPPPVGLDERHPGRALGRASCWDTADGVRYVAAATPVRVPRSASSRSSSRWRTSM